MINNSQSCLEVVPLSPPGHETWPIRLFLGDFPWQSGCQGCVQMTRGSGRDGLKHDVRSAAQAPAQCQNLNHTRDFRHPEIRGIPLTLMRKVGNYAVHQVNSGPGANWLFQGRQVGATSLGAWPRQKQRRSLKSMCAARIRIYGLTPFTKSGSTS